MHFVCILQCVLINKSHVKYIGDFHFICFIIIIFSLKRSVDPCCCLGKHRSYDALGTPLAMSESFQYAKTENKIRIKNEK